MNRNNNQIGGRARRGLPRLCFLLTALAWLIAGPVMAQGSLDDMRYNRWTKAHDGSGDVDKAAYGIGQNSYAGEVSSTNLMNYRSSFKLFLKLEEPKVEQIDSALCKRAVEEAINIAEHKLDVAWMAEKDRITQRLNAFHDRVQRIDDYNGTMEAYTYYDLCEKRFLCAVKALQDSYQANSLKKREYTALYEEILNANASLVRYLDYCRAKDRIVIPDTVSVRRPTVRQLASNARTRWLTAASQAHR